MKWQLFLPLLLVPLVIVDCSPKPKLSFRAFQQQDAADLVVGFWHWDSLVVEKPAVLKEGKDYLARMTKKDFLDRLEKLSIRRGFVIVIFDKRIAPAGKAVSMDELEAFFRGLGFRRIVFQLAQSNEHPDGLPILRDTEERR